MYCTGWIGRLVLGTVLFVPAFAWAAHPLITDDSGTQGKGKFQFELNAQYDRDEETVAGVPTKSTGEQVGATLSYGIIENADLVLSLAYVRGKVEEDGTTVYDEKGISDTTFEVKWRFFEKEGWSFALKPGFSFPTGDENKGLGTGRTGYHVFLIASKEAAAWAFHANLGYIRNENKVDEEKNIWHASLATTYEVVKDLKVVGNLGIERNPDKTSDNDPAFLIGGFIYSVSKNFDLDLGVKYGLTSSETDLSVLAGIAFRF
ncbi:MAG: transporter [Deltaproteobacteria bacterium]|nr:transporter [Deltaproteobacteria bacterium]